MQISVLGRQYLKERRPSPKTCEAYELAYGQFMAFLMGLGLTDDIRHFTPENVNAFSTYLLEHGRKATSVHLKLSALHSLGEFGVKTKDARGHFILAENPLTRVYRPKRETPPEKYLYENELKRFLAEPCSAGLRVAIGLIVDTALRVSEICNANVEHLSLDGERVVLAVTVKGGKHRTVVLGAEMAERLLALLKQREVKPSDPLVVNEHGVRYRRGVLTEAVLRLAVRAGITRIKVRAHVIRHSVATLAIKLGADVPTVAAMLNHSGLGTIQRYIHRQDAVDAAREAVRAGLCLTPSKIEGVLPPSRI